MILSVEQGTDLGREMRLERGLVTIGRGGECDFDLQETQASRKHAELRRYGDHWLVVDLGSTNGTIAGGIRLQPHVARRLSPGEPVLVGGTRLVLREEPSDREVGQADGGPHPATTGAAGTSPVWGVCTWIARGIVVAGCALIVMGSLSEWIEIDIQLPVVPIGVNRVFSGMDSGFAWLFIGLAVVSLLLVLMDITSRRWGLSAGLGQALLAAAVLAAIAVQVRQYYQAGTQKLLGISLIDVLTKYAKDLVDITPKPGIYALGVGLAGLIIGGLVRLVVAGLEPSDS